ncbi:MAG: acyl-CoA reductase [Candidatus Binatia bacterium]|nr:MAG: acyl-CoA reductase [Candidatus Binatia bacterium]
MPGEVVTERQTALQCNAAEESGCSAAEAERRVQAACMGPARLRSIPTRELVARVGRVVEAWLQPDSFWMAKAVAKLPAATGFHQRMIAHALPFQLEMVMASELLKFLDREIGPPEVMDHRDRPQRLVVHIISGNIPALAAVPMVLGVVTKQPTIIKPAAGDPLFAHLFWESMHSLDPEICAALAVIDWRGGVSPAEAVVLDAADVVVAMGGTEAMAALAQRVGRRLHALGPRLSFAFIGRECLSGESEAGAWARALAYDVSVWDQRGCLSPQIAFVEDGAPVGPGDFARMLADSLAGLCTELPPRRLALEEQLAVIAFRDEAEWRPGTELLASTGSLNWAIALESSPRFLPTPLHRCVRIQPIADVRDLLPLLAPHKPLLEAAGVAVSPERWARVRGVLFEAGVHWVTPLGSMQRPTLQWRPGGRSRIEGWFS